MSDMAIGGLGPAGAPASVAPLGGPAAKGPSFGEALTRALGEVNALQQQADQAVQAFALGQSRDVTATLLAVEKANLALQLTLQVRAKLVDAYQEIMKTSI